MDLDHDRYETFDELLEYCRRVASAVGLICIEIFGCRDRGARDYAMNLGLALQLTNIVRDVKVDLERGRVYLPQEDLRRVGCTEEDLARGVVTAPVARAAGVRDASARASISERATAALPRAEAPAPGGRRDHGRDLLRRSCAASSAAATTCSRASCACRGRRGSASRSGLGAHGGRRWLPLSQMDSKPRVSNALADRRRRDAVSAADVVVIGAGFAGLSAASALADAGARVLVLEAPPGLGGRATAFRDRETGRVVDNGQHVLLGCYRRDARASSSGSAPRDMLHRQSALRGDDDRRARPRAASWRCRRCPRRCISSPACSTGTALALADRLSLAAAWSARAAIAARRRAAERLTVRDWLIRTGRRRGSARCCGSRWRWPRSISRSTTRRPRPFRRGARADVRTGPGRRGAVPADAAAGRDVRRAGRARSSRRRGGGDGRTPRAAHRGRPASASMVSACATK